MITLQDIFIDLSGGEFSNLRIGAFSIEDPESEPDPRAYLQLIRHVNLGLTALYTEFFLRSDSVIIDLDDTISEYHVDYRWATSNAASTEPIKYIADTVANPFGDNLLKIEEIYDEEGTKLPLNDPDDDESLYTTRFDTIQHPTPATGNSIEVLYRADHPTIAYSAGMDPADVYVEVPRQLREALLYYVAARVYAGINSEKPEANDYWQKYLTKVQDTHRQGLYIQTDIDNARFSEGGWC